MSSAAQVSATEQATELLTALVRTDSINPMGGSYTRQEPVERQVHQVIEEWLAPVSDRLSITRQSCSPIHESLVIRLEGAAEGPAALFESHADTVPADEWPDRALQPVLDNGELIGRGACDDKGSLAAMVLALARLVKEGITPPRPVVLVCAGDEEFAQTGIRHFREQSQEQFAYGVFGEPTQLVPVIQHKGTIRWDITVHGTSAHTSRPELGRNAVLGMVEVVAALGRYQDHLQQTWTNRYLTGPLVTVTMVRGGRTRNATADECTLAVDFRILPGMEAESEKQALIDFLAAEIRWELTHAANQLITPPLNTDPELPFCRQLLATCRTVAGNHLEFRGEPYGTDAAWVSDLCPAVVLGPGDIAVAHAVDERIPMDQVVAATELYSALMREPFTIQ